MARLSYNRVKSGANKNTMNIKAKEYRKTLNTSQGRIQDFKLGGGGALKKLEPSGGRRETFWGISCEKSRFYARKSYFCQKMIRKVSGRL